ncbi:MAG: ribosome maturation factor RimM [Clostridia bacterium]|nr:ribosome maturation factor RimM [Clostridia bacterium]
MPIAEYLVVAQVARPHGVRGEIKARSWSDDAGRLEQIAEVFLSDNGKYKPVAVEDCRARGDTLYYKLQGINTPEAVDALREQYLYVKRADAAPLEPGAFYIADLIGCRVVTADGAEVGVLKDVQRTGANDIYEVKTPDGKTVFLPAIKQVVLKAEPANDIITVDMALIAAVEELKG